MRFRLPFICSTGREFLQNVSISDVFELTDRNNNTTRYEVSDIKIIDATKQDIAIHSNQNELKLVTCYPFDALIARGPLRYIVSAKMI